MADYSRLPGPVSAVWEWQQHGACRDVDPEVFFHPEGERGPSKDTRDREAVAVCATCPVIAECRRHALTVREPYGVWGGLTVEDRDLIVVRERRTTAYAVPGPDRGTLTEDDQQALALAHLRLRTLGRPAAAPGREHCGFTSGVDVHPSTP